MLVSQRSIIFICFGFLSKIIRFIFYISSTNFSITIERDFLLLSAIQQLATGLICFHCTIYDDVNSNNEITNVSVLADYSCYVSNTIIAFVSSTERKFEFFCFSLPKSTSTVSGVTTINLSAMINCVIGIDSLGATTESV
jgi:hypothetical protein